MVNVLAIPHPCPICGRMRTVGSMTDTKAPCVTCARWAAIFDHPVGPWVADGLCAQTDPEIFFPESSLNFALDAKAVCAECPVRTECLTYALEANEQHGIWGGLTPKERQKLKKGSAA